MEPDKQTALASAGWHFGPVAEFLGLTPQEHAEVERRLAGLPPRRPRSKSEIRRVAFMVEGERKAEKGEPR